MLNLSNSLIICSSLLLHMFLVAGTWGSMTVTGHMGVENLYVEKSVVLPPLPQNPCALMSSLASSCLFAVHIAKASPRRGAAI